MLPYFCRCRRLRREMRMKILLQLCLSYSIVTLLLVLMSVARDNEAACTAFSVLLHYLVLVSIAWTSAEAFYLHGVLINVYGKEVNHYFLKLCAFAWGKSGTQWSAGTVGITCTDTAHRVNLYFCLRSLHWGICTSYQIFSPWISYV